MKKIVVLLALGLLLGLAAQPAAAKDLKVGFVYVSPVGDAGWSYAHNRGRLAVEAMDGVTTSFVESVKEGPDSERVIQNMARKGYDVIFATSFGYMDPMLKVSENFPRLFSCTAPGTKPANAWATISAACIRRATCPVWWPAP